LITPSDICVDVEVFETHEATEWECLGDLPVKEFYSRSHDAVIRVYDEAGNVIGTREQVGDFKEW
jgi:hypothetical protein